MSRKAEFLARIRAYVAGSISLNDLRFELASFEGSFGPGGEGEALADAVWLPLSDYQAGDLEEDGLRVRLAEVLRDHHLVLSLRSYLPTRPR